jgi:plasmid stabilization system protein ParE
VKKSYLLTKQAEADLREITLYTLKQWGKLQCNSYIAELEKKAEDVATGKGFYKEIPALLPNLRVVLAGKHYIFCLPQENSPALILAILHEKMDLVARLKHRLPS